MGCHSRMRCRPPPFAVAAAAVAAKVFAARAVPAHRVAVAGVLVVARWTKHERWERVWGTRRPRWTTPLAGTMLSWKWLPIRTQCRRRGIFGGLCEGTSGRSQLGGGDAAVADDAGVGSNGFFAFGAIGFLRGSWTTTTVMLHAMPDYREALPRPSLCGSPKGPILVPKPSFSPWLLVVEDETKQSSLNSPVNSTENGVVSVQKFEFSLFNREWCHSNKRARVGVSM